MKGFLLPLCCCAVLGAQLVRAASGEMSPTQSAMKNGSTEFSTNASSTIASTTITSTTITSTTTICPTTTKSVPPASSWIPFGLECRSVAMVGGGLIVGCTILLISTLMLACKVCHLSRQVRMLSSSDLVSSSENSAVTAKKVTNKAEANETTVLMSDMGQTERDSANGAANGEEGGQGKVAEQAAEETKEEAPPGDSQETPAAAAEVPSASQPQEDVTNGQSSVAAASPSAEEPKDA